jgi:DNA-directed RNA polymerase specialized sigma24 family protein
VVLRFLNGLTTAETAMTMSKTEDAVKKLQARGLVQLRRILEQAHQVGGRSARRPLAPMPAVAVLGAA